MENREEKCVNRVDKITLRGRGRGRSSFAVTVSVYPHKLDTFEVKVATVWAWTVSAGRSFHP